MVSRKIRIQKCIDTDFKNKTCTFNWTRDLIHW